MKPPSPKTPEQEAPDPYEVLGIASDASDDAVKKAYLAQVREYPPERAPQEFKRIRAAYDELKTPEKRLQIDMTRPQSWPEPALESETRSAVSLKVERADIVRAARAQTDLERTDWRADGREIKL